MDTTQESKTQNPDWSKLAQEALDLWQEHLAAYAADPAAKEALTQLATPPLDMARQMFAEWSGMMQHGKHESAHDTPPSGDDGSQTAERGRAPSDDGRALDMAELASRVAELERQLAGLQSQLAASPLAPYLAWPAAHGGGAGGDAAGAHARAAKRRKA